MGSMKTFLLQSIKHQVYCQTKKPGFHKVSQLFLIKQCKINVSPSKRAKHFFPPYKPYERILKTNFYEYISIILLILKLEKRNTNFWLLKNPLGVSAMRTLS